MSKLVTAARLVLVASRLDANIRHHVNPRGAR